MCIAICYKVVFKEGGKSYFGTSTSAFLKPLEKASYRNYIFLIDTNQISVAKQLIEKIIFMHKCLS